MEGYTPGEQPRDPGVVKLNTNENPYPPSPMVERALRELAVESLRKYPDPTAADLRARIAELHGCRPDQVLVGNGSDELLALCVRALVPRDAGVGWFEPSYSLYPVLARMEELRACPAELGPDYGWRDPDVPTAGLFFITRPNAPTGTLFPEDAVRSFAARFAGVTAIDEAYADFAPADMSPFAAGSERTIVFRTLSKSFSLAGLRVGYAVGPAPLIAAMAKIKDSYNVDRVAQVLALAALSDLDWMRANAERIRGTRERAAAALREMGCQVHPSATNFLWVRPPGISAAETAAALRARRVLVRHFPGPMTGDHLRVTVGTDAEMEVFLAAMKSVIG